MDKGKVHLIQRRRYEDVERGGAEILCVCSGGFQKSVRSRGSS